MGLNLCLFKNLLKIEKMWKLFAMKKNGAKILLENKFLEPKKN